MQGAAKGKLEFKDPKSGKTYKLGDKPCTLKVRDACCHAVVILASSCIT